MVLDVGAFIGAHTLLSSRLVGPEGRVVAFEPDGRARARLERNLRRNGAANVTVLRTRSAIARGRSASARAATRSGMSTRVETATSRW